MDFVGKPDYSPCYSLAINKGAIAALKVFYNKTIPVPGKPGVVTGYLGEVENNMIIRRAAYGNCFVHDSALYTKNRLQLI